MKTEFSRWIAVIVLGLISGMAHAGVLELTNGDRLKGTLSGMDKTSVVWRSEIFGELKVDKAKVVNIRSEDRVHVQGQSQPCVITGVDDHQLLYRCGQAVVNQRTPIMTVASVVPYVDHATAKPAYAGKVAAAGVFSRGNKIEDDLDADAEVSLRYGDLRHVAGIEYDSRSVDDEPAVEDYETRYRMDWFFQEQWFWYNELRWAAEDSKNVEERYTFGTGLGVQIWEDPEKALALESGLDYISEEYDVADGSEDSVEQAVWRFATGLRYKLPFSATLVNTNEFLYSLEASEDWEFSSDLGLSMPLGQGLFSEYKIEYDHDNLPAEGTKRDDTKLTVGIGYEW